VPQGMNSNEFRHSDSPGSTSLFIRQHTLKTEPTPASLEKNALDELYKPYLVKDIFPKMLYSSEDTEKLSKYMTDIDAYMKKSFASWIVKGGVDDEWDGYVKKLNEMGLQQVMDIHQKTYEKYKSFK
jgi:putative aldouronate transport system substrate-binding protein